MSEECLKSVFNNIDTHNTNNIDIGELSEYFSTRLTNFKGVFEAVEDLNRGATDSLSSTAESYESSESERRFVTRFILRELSKQLMELHRVFDNAHDAIEERERQNLGSKQPMVARQSSKPQEPKPVRRYRAQLSNPEGARPMSCEVQIDRLNAQLDRFDRMLRTMDHSIRFSALDDERVSAEEENTVSVSRRRLKLREPTSLHEVRPALQKYIEAANAVPASMHICVRHFTDENVLVLYEIWNSEKAKLRFQASEESQELGCALADHVTEAEVTSQTCLPSAWFEQCS